MERLVYHCGELCEAFGFVHRATGKPNRSVLYGFVREGRFPPPIDMELPYAYWAWSRADVERYASGEWKAAS